MVKRGLGRGLGSLIPSLGTGQIEVEELPVDQIRPNKGQPRVQFEERALAELTASIDRHGLIQPVIVRSLSEGYELIAGERRWRAAREAGLTAIPAVIKKSSEAESLQLALVENIQRQDLNALEEARAFRRLVDDFGLTQAELAELVGKGRATIANTLRLLNLSEEVQRMVLEDRLSSGHARALLGLAEPEQQLRLAERISTESLSVRRTEELVRVWGLAKEQGDKKKVPVPPEVRVLARRLGRQLGIKTRVRRVRDKLKLELEISDPGDIERLEKALAELADQPGS